jgi:hypothetical protein
MPVAAVAGHRMPKPDTAPYGSWRSPITSDLIVAQVTMLSDVRLDGEDPWSFDAALTA